MNEGICTWCHKEVNKQDFDMHTGEHYRKQVELIKINPSTTFTSISSVSYVKELGQVLLSNTPSQSYDAGWATEGLNLIAEVIAEYRGYQYETYGYSNLLTSNSGDPEFVNDVFEMRPYCWCDSEWGEYEGPHPDGCAPNFVYKKNGLIITWYKHANRGISANMEYPGAKNWAKAVMTCIDSVGSK